MVQCSGGIVLLGGGNLTRSNFDHCCLVEGGRGGDKNLVGGGEEQIFWGGLPPFPPVGKTLHEGWGGGRWGEKKAKIADRYGCLKGCGRVKNEVCGHPQIQKAIRL